MVDATVDEVERLLQLADHPTTPSALRTRLSSLRVEAARSPARALERFDLIAARAVAALRVDDPASTLYRAQSLATYLRHCVETSYRSLDYETFRRRVQRAAEPDALLTSVLDRSGTVFPRKRSWMVAASHVPIRRASGRELMRLLELGQQQPPFVLCVMPLARLLDAGVQVRPPTAADAALGRHNYWNPAGLTIGREYIDLDVPGVAVEEVLWRP